MEKENSLTFITRVFNNFQNEIPQILASNLAIPEFVMA
jgi:hypothetical protein